MVQSQSCHRYVFKLHSSRLKKANWDLILPLSAARKSKDDLISINDSQLLRFIDELNQRSNSTNQLKEIKQKIHRLHRMPVRATIRKQLENLYESLYQIQFQEDYLCLVIDNNKEYDRANKGFKVNGKEYKRFLGTNGGVKDSTIVYVSKRLYPQLKEKLDNGRNKNIPMIPAKLEAYQALVCSSSTVVSMPQGIIVVPDCVTRFQSKAIQIDDQNEGEPVLHDLEHADISLIDSDGYGFMLPSYSRKINKELEQGKDCTVPGVTIRGLPWVKGMLYTFDYLKFAETIAFKYYIKDLWGSLRDVRTCEVILTASMLKLWDSYSSFEEYWEHTIKNGYQFAIAKAAPQHLEQERCTNYQFLQSFQLNDSDLEELILPTITELKEVMGLDYRKTLTFLCGKELTEDLEYNLLDLDFVKALMAEPRVIADPFIRNKIHSLLMKKIKQAKIGVLKVHSNFAFICGDPYSLAQSIFQLEITGLLRAGETYHKFWIDHKVSELLAFRAPMTCHNNIRKLSVVNSKAMEEWYQYLSTCMLLNSWDTTCDALNGADKDGDLFFTTDNPVLVRNHRPLPALLCIQRKADKKIVSEEDIIKSNKLSFGDSIGAITNTITKQFEVQAGFPLGSIEYQTMEYRILCGQLFQQNAIDKTKGIVAKPMPLEWVDPASLKEKEEDSKEDAARKKSLYPLLSFKSPYFFIYNYPKLHSEYKSYQEKQNNSCEQDFGYSLMELLEKRTKTDREQLFLDYYHQKLPIGTNACLMNRLCRFVEQKLKISPEVEPTFDYSILKPETNYKKKDYTSISNIYKEYKKRATDYSKLAKEHRQNKMERSMEREIMIQYFKMECEKICPNERILCSIVLDLCYNSQSSKQFAWDICGTVIVQHLLEKNHTMISYPVRDSKGEFTFCGETFTMHRKQINGED